MTDQRSNSASAVPVLRRALVWGALVCLVIAVVGGVIGVFVAGATGVVSALIGAAIAAAFLAVTALSILVANRATIELFFGIVLGAWLLKAVVFMGALFLLRGQPFIHGPVLFGVLAAAVLATLVVDVLVVTRSRVPYVSDAKLPGDQ
jgi:hypothetical protein